MAKSFRLFELLIYPDSESYKADDVIQAACEYFDDWAYMLHDSDVIKETGELKKAHIHFVGRCDTARQISAVSNKCGIPENSIEVKNSFRYSVRYLVHLDQPEKFQYSFEHVKSNFDVNRYMKVKSDAHSVVKIIALMDEYKPQSMEELVLLCYKHDLFDCFKRSYTMWKDIFHERKVI